MAKLIPILLDELQQEFAITEKFLKLIPEDQYDWKPHTKSMSLKQLSVHIAEIAGWPAMGIQSSEWDFAKTPYTPTPIENNHDLIQLLKKGLNDTIKALNQTKEEDLDHQWQLKYGDKILLSLSKYGFIRHAISQNIHHRAQLGVFLRLLNIPIPGTYGPSADDSNGF